MGLCRDLKGNYVGESIFEKNDTRDLVFMHSFGAGGLLWALTKDTNNDYLKHSHEFVEYHVEPVLSQQLQGKLDKLYEIFMTSFDSSYPPDSGFHTIEEVRYFLYFELYVATLLSCEYKQGKVLLYGDERELLSIAEYIVYLSKITDEDLKLSLRADLPADTSNT